MLKLIFTFSDQYSRERISVKGTGNFYDDSWTVEQTYFDQTYLKTAKLNGKIMYEGLSKINRVRIQWKNDVFGAAAWVIQINDDLADTVRFYSAEDTTDPVAVQRWTYLPKSLDTVKSKHVTAPLVSVNYAASSSMRFQVRGAQKYHDESWKMTIWSYGRQYYPSHVKNGRFVYVTQQKMNVPTNTIWSEISFGHAEKFNGQPAWTIASIDEFREPKEIVTFVSFEDVTFPPHAQTWQYVADPFSVPIKPSQVAPLLQLTYLNGLFLSN